MSTTVETGLRGYPWETSYYTSDLPRNGKPVNILHDFYLPALERAVRYDRVAGYFRSTSLAAASQGYTAFLRNGGHMRLIVGADLQIQDVAAILAGDSIRLSDRLMGELKAPELWPEDVQRGVSLLARMVSGGQLELRVGLRRDPNTGKALSMNSIEDGYVHEKWFVMTDAEGYRILGSGSLNESRTALTLNAENLEINCDWEYGREKKRVDDAVERFRALWENRNPHVVVLPLPEAVSRRLVQLRDLQGCTTEIDGTLFVEEVKPSLEELLRFAVLRDAPRMPGGRFIGMYSAPVEPWPHQEMVSRRLVESWPYSYLMCDEVGLGKTIEAALAIRSLVLSGLAKRVLIVAPASLTDQWQRELAQKAMLPFWKSRPKAGGAGKMEHTRIYPVQDELLDQNLYSPDLNIVSSSLVRRKERQGMLLAARDYDIVLVDEAHYARRQNPRSGSEGAPRYGQLYAAIRDILGKKTKCLWLATATPMQIDSVEVYDLFALTDRVGPYQTDPTLTKHYFSLLGRLLKKETLSREEWELLGRSFSQIQMLDPFLWKLLGNSVMNSKNRKVLQNLPQKDPKKGDVRYLLPPLFSASPLSRVMMRHTRLLLEKYREHGDLKSNLAKRHVRPICAVCFTEAEERFYAMLEEYCTELSRQMRKCSGRSRQMMNFYLSFLQLRFASSLYAIEETLKRRRRRVVLTLEVQRTQPEGADEDALAELEDSESEYTEDNLDDAAMDALLKDRTTGDLEWEEIRLGTMLDELNRMRDTPSKIQKLLEELDTRKLADGRMGQTVVFTRFLDTLKSIRHYLELRDRELRVGVYSGEVVTCYSPVEERDLTVSREEIRDLFLAGEIDLLLCTDAAAEGLNLQTADLLINFDLGWNPMKVEQRIGRIDRIGQKYREIQVLNMCYLGSTEETVYGRLYDHLKEANLVVGTQQISLLPVEPREFRDLQSRKISEAELEERSRARLKAQQEAVSSMEMGADDQYEMYRRLSEHMRAAPAPAGLRDLQQALLSSPALISRGATMSDGVWHLPGSSDYGEISAVTERERISSTASLLTWDNAGVGQVLEWFCSQIPEDGPLRRISVSRGGLEVCGYLVATVSGAVLVTGMGQLENLNICPQGRISDREAEAGRRELAALLDTEEVFPQTAAQAVQENLNHARLQKILVQTVAISLLEEEQKLGYGKLQDALAHLSGAEAEGRFVSLPPEVFLNMDSRVLFPIRQMSGEVFVPVQEILLDCAREAILRTADVMKGRKTELTVEEVLARLRR